MNITSNNLTALGGLFTARFPDRHNIQISDFEEIVDGWETKIYSFALQYLEKGQLKMHEYVIRFYFGESQNQQAEREFNTMTLLRKHQVPIPEVVLYQKENSFFGQAFIVMDKILGPTMADLVNTLNTEETRVVLAKMAISFVQLHRISAQAIFPDTNILREDYLTGLIEEMETKVNKYGVDEFKPIIHILKNGLPGIGQVHLGVIHNDYHPQNVLVQQASGIYFTIDWSFAEVGDFRLDLAWTLLLVGTMVGRQYRAAFLKSYENASGINVEHLEYFETLKLAQRILTILTWVDGQVQIPIRKITKEALRGEYKIHVLNVYDQLKEITGVYLPTIEQL